MDLLFSVGGVCRPAQGSSRWLLEGSDTPWFGSVTLYRQGSDCDWRPVLERVAADLRGVCRMTVSADLSLVALARALTLSPQDPGAGVGYGLVLAGKG